ncbi:RTA1-domain-containing protein [Glonium stellatum]|uniref:RTA1-domain-containing protein n=1 Tax=Glonium stellatum TaxID=574774 RepID=A0A8E2ETU3_9PEZI|nr:RTA1-domain-containing protein [Glonium stellatum]
MREVRTIITMTVDKNGIDPNHLNFNTTNSTLIAMQRRYCHLGKCPISWATISYIPNLGGNVVYMICFLVLLGAQIFFGIRYKTWKFLVPMIFGLLLEIIGYIGRIMLHNNPFIENNFLLYLICLTIGPAFFSACIYLCLGRLITVISPENSRLKPKTYTKVFVGCDLLALVLQAVGGAIASTAKDHAGSTTGTNVMVAGLASQVLSMLLFMILWADFGLRVRKARLAGTLRHTQPPLYEPLRQSKTFSAFQWSLAIATVLIFVRSVYRVAELAEGFSGSIANEQAPFMIFEGPMIIIAVALLTWYHPGRVFHELWVPAGLGVRAHKLGQDSTVELSERDEWKNNSRVYNQQV